MLYHTQAKGTLCVNPERFDNDFVYVRGGDFARIRMASRHFAFSASDVFDA